MTDTHKEKRSPSLLRRYEKVIGVLLKYGFEDVVAHPPFNRLKGATSRLLSKRDGRSVLEFTRYERIRLVCQELGPTYIKFAQIMANRPDILPEELLEELEKFQDQAKPVPEKAIRDILHVAYGKPVEEVFDYFNPEAIASASMAQVHRARLKDGQEVVLKVQRPGISITIEEDIAILKSLARLLENNFPSVGAFQPIELVKMFEKSIRKELRFTLEMANLNKFSRYFSDNKDIYVPKAYPEYTTDKVLCMEYIDGLKITDLKNLEKIGLDGPKLALKGINLYFQQVFEHGFFHADPHPGNIFILPDTRVCFIDYGMMGTVIEADKELLADLLLTIHEQDVEGLKKALKSMSWDREKIDDKQLEYEIIEFFEEYSEITLENMEGTEVIATLNNLFFTYKIKVPSNLLLLLKALVIIEGVGLALDPKYNIIANIAPFVKRLLAKKFAPQKIMARLGQTGLALYKLSAKLPEDVGEIVSKLKKGKLHIEFEHKGMEPLLRKLETVSNRISFTLLLVALLVSSALLVIADVAPHYKDMPVLGVGGFVLSGLLALRLMYSILRHGNF
ncbi:MAG: AarF/ABC1/UbiB kinase family protein [Saprospiraceae bacterium]